MKSWPLKKLGEVTRVLSGATPSTSVAEYWNGKFLWVTPKDLGSLEGVEISSTERRISQTGFDSCAVQLIPPGSVVMSSRAPIGHLAINTAPVCTNQGCKSFVPSDELDARFLFWTLRAFMPAIKHMGEGCTFHEVSKTDMEEFEIPVPPLPEQRRIVARVETLTTRSEKLRQLNLSLVEDMSRLLSAEYSRIASDAPTCAFSEVARLVRRPVVTKPDEAYPEMGIRSFGKGTFHKPALTGTQLGTKRIFRIKAGDLVLMNVFAWEGAIAVAQPADDGRVASHRFMTHEVLPERATAEFLCYHFLTEYGLERIRGASPGSAGRNRTLGIKKLEKIPVPVPPVEEQRRFARLVRRQFELQQLQREVEVELASFTPALLAKAFRGEL